MRPPQFEVSKVDRGWIKQIGWRSVEDVLAHSADGLAAVSSTSDVVEVPVDPAFGGPTKVFVKRYRYDRLSQRIKQAFRGTLFGKSRARREYDFLMEMRRRHVATVRPIACGDTFGLAFLRASFLITEGVEGFQSLDLFALDTLRRTHLDRSQRRILTRALAEAIRKMHDAGVRHGGLFWRNILLRVPPDDGRYDFVLLDPDTHGRMTDSRVPASDVVADLAELVASAIALGRRAGLMALMKAYFQVSRLTAAQRQMARRIIELARPLVPSERRRMAVTEAIGWLRHRSAVANRGDHGFGAFDSVDDFFESVSSGEVTSALGTRAGQSIRFSFSGEDATNGIRDRTVLVNGDQITVSDVRPAEHDLVIRTDAETWLAVISGSAGAYDRLRAGRLRMEGDTTVLHALMDHLDPTDSKVWSPESPRGVEAGIRGESKGGLGVIGTSGNPPPRRFGGKYKADDYAHYYAEKHHSSFGRRISNHFEKRMIRRSLLRVRRARPFQSVLDCPSGTGRFLPTLAPLNVSVIAMDTSGAMLREGRIHHGLFKEPPVELVGSALDIPLPDDAVDVVLCSRLLHHFASSEDRVTILKEFARVARVGVVLSFFDSKSLRAWKRERKARRTGKRGGRHAISRAACVEEAVAAGLQPIGMNALLRFHTEVTAAAFLC